MWFRVFTIALALGFTGLLVTQFVLTGPEAGPLLLVLGHGHGLHDTDVVALGTWGLGMTACAVLWHSASARPRP